MKLIILLLLLCLLPVSVSEQATNGLDRTATSSIETGRDKNGIVLSLIDKNIILPIVNDEPDLKKAIVPPRYRVKIVK